MRNDQQAHTVAESADSRISVILWTRMAWRKPEVTNGQRGEKRKRRLLTEKFKDRKIKAEQEDEKETCEYRRGIATYCPE